MEFTLSEAKVVEFGFDLIIAIFRGVWRRGDDEAAAEGEVVVVFPAEGRLIGSAVAVHNKNYKLSRLM